MQPLFTSNIFQDPGGSVCTMTGVDFLLESLANAQTLPVGDQLVNFVRQ